MMFEIKINNVAAYAEKYEFIVARPVDGEFWFWGAYRTKADAKEAAEEVEGFVFHNPHF